MTNGEKLEQIFPDGICPFSKSWLDYEYKEPKNKLSSGTRKNSQKLEKDCISREQAIKETDKLCLETGYDNEKVEEMLRELPPVTPIRPKGHWIRVAKDKLRCSECDVIHFIAQYPQGKIAWCPNCGADMREVEE